MLNRTSTNKPMFLPYIPLSHQLIANAAIIPLTTIVETILSITLQYQPQYLPSNNSIWTSWIAPLYLQDRILLWSNATSLLKPVAIWIVLITTVIHDAPQQQSNYFPSTTYVQLTVTIQQSDLTFSPSISPDNLNSVTTSYLTSTMHPCHNSASQPPSPDLIL